MSFSTIKTKLVALVQTSSLVSAVYDYDKPTFENSPIVTIVPSGNESDFGTVMDNARTYAFTVTVMVALDPSGNQTAESTLVGIIDDLLDRFDNDVTLTGEVLRMDASPSAWGYQTREKLYRVATINIKCFSYYRIT